jgi:hypothetical protein
MALILTPRAGSAGLIATLQKWGVTISNLLGTGAFAATLGFRTSIGAATAIGVDQNIWWQGSTNCYIMNVPASGWRCTSLFFHFVLNIFANPILPGGSVEIELLEAPTSAGPFTSVYLHSFIAGVPPLGGVWVAFQHEFQPNTAIRFVVRVMGVALSGTGVPSAAIVLEDLN